MLGVETQAWASQEMEVEGKVLVGEYPEWVLDHQQREALLVVSLEIFSSFLAVVEVHYHLEAVDLAQLHSILVAVAFLVVVEKRKEQASQILLNHFLLFSFLFCLTSFSHPRFDRNALAVEILVCEEVSFALPPLEALRCLQEDLPLTYAFFEPLAYAHLPSFFPLVARIFALHPLALVLFHMLEEVVESPLHSSRTSWAHVCLLLCLSCPTFSFPSFVSSVENHLAPLILTRHIPQCHQG